MATTSLITDSSSEEAGPNPGTTAGVMTDLSVQGGVQVTDTVSDQTKPQPQSQPQVLVQAQTTSQPQPQNKTWSDIVSEAEHFVSDQPVLSHKPEVAPVFLNFKCMAREGIKIPLIEVAATVGQVVGDTHVDGVQPMHSGWQIYVKTDKDHEVLITQGIQLAGKWISLQAPTQTPGFSMNAKIILRSSP